MSESVLTEGPIAVSPDRSCRSLEGKLDLREAISPRRVSLYSQLAAKPEQPEKEKKNKKKEDGKSQGAKPTTGQESPGDGGDQESNP